MKKGPSLHNIWVNPKVEVLSDHLGDGYNECKLQVYGLLCGGWVARVKGVLERMPQTDKVVFNADEEAFVVQYRGDKRLGAEFSQKVMSAVIVRGARKMLGDVGKKLSKNKWRPIG